MKKVLSLTDGRKSYAGGLLFAMYGISGYLTGELTTSEGLGAIGVALVIVGVAHKIEKLRDALTKKKK